LTLTGQNARCGEHVVIKLESSAHQASRILRQSNEIRDCSILSARPLGDQNAQTPPIAELWLPAPLFLKAADLDAFGRRDDTPLT